MSREFIIDALSVERNHLLVRVGVVGGPSERKLPPRDLQQVSLAPLHSVTLVNIRHASARLNLHTFSRSILDGSRFSATLNASASSGAYSLTEVCRLHFSDLRICWCCEQSGNQEWIFQTWEWNANASWWSWRWSRAKSCWFCNHVWRNLKKKIVGLHVGLCFWFLLSPKTCMPLCVFSFELLKM